MRQGQRRLGPSSLEKGGEILIHATEPLRHHPRLYLAGLAKRYLESTSRVQRFVLTKHLYEVHGGISYNVAALASVSPIYAAVVVAVASGHYQVGNA